MPTITYDRSLPDNAARAWAAFSIFENLLVWNPLDLTLEIQGQGIGMVRTLVIPNFGRVGERLDENNHEQHQQTYTLVEGQPLGMQTYAAKIRFEAVDESSCVIHWEGEFTCAASADEHKVGESLRGSYIGMSESLANHLQNQPAT